MGVTEQFSLWRSSAKTKTLKRVPQLPFYLISGTPQIADGLRTVLLFCGRSHGRKRSTAGQSHHIQPHTNIQGTELGRNCGRSTLISDGLRTVSLNRAVVVTVFHTSV